MWKLVAFLSYRLVNLSPSSDDERFAFFSVANQLIDLLLNEDWSTYFADHGQTTSKYSRVNPSVVIKLLEK